MPERFHFHTRHLLYASRRGPAEALLAVVAALTAAGGAILTRHEEQVEVTLGSLEQFRLLGIAAPARAIPIRVQIVVEARERGSRLSIWISPAHWYSDRLTWPVAWAFGRAAKHARTLLERGTNLELISRSLSDLTPFDYAGATPRAIMEEFLSDVATEPGIDQALRDDAVAAFDLLVDNHLPETVRRAQQIVDVLRKLPRENGARRLVEWQVDGPLRELEREGSTP